MILTFRTAYFTRINKLFITTPSSIAYNYLTTWFTVDFLSTFPVDTVAMAIIQASSSTATQVVSVADTGTFSCFCCFFLLFFFVVFFFFCFFVFCIETPDTLE